MNRIVSAAAIFASVVLAAGLSAARVSAAPSCCSAPMPKVQGLSDKPATLMPNLGHLHHAVATKSPQAQAFFDQGLTLVYCFNFPEAYRSFRQAAALDPKLAMGYWGMAMALGPNYNQSDDPSLEHDAMIPMRQALALKASGSSEDRAFIDALSHRLSSDPKADLKGLDRAYADAMRSVYKAYPSDPDAATLYADSLMNVRPWHLWTSDGKPAPGTNEIVAVLRKVLAAHPDHLGANHLFIHAVEASPHPEDALPCADRIPKLALAAGHIVHMPSHIYMRIGDYESASTANEGAIEADNAYFKANGGMTGYGMYLAHNTAFLSAARAMEGRYADAKAAADSFAVMAQGVVGQYPFVEGGMALPLLIDARFHRWDGIAAAKEPDAKYKMDHAWWAYAQGLADAAKGNTPSAEARLAALEAAVPRASNDVMMAQATDRQLLSLASAILTGEVRRAKGDTAGEIDALRHAVVLQDAFPYDEPEDFYYPARESYGAALLRANRYKEAESVFRKELTIHRHSGWALCGLTAALNGEHKASEAAKAQTQFTEAWRRADTPIRAEEL